MAWRIERRAHTELVDLGDAPVRSPATRPGQVITKAGMLEQCHCEPAAPRPDGSLGKPRQLEEPDVPRLQELPTGQHRAHHRTRMRRGNDGEGMQAIRSDGGNHPRNPSTPVVAYQVNPVDPRGIDKGHDVLDELVELASGT